MVQSYGPVGAIAMQHTRNFQKAVPLPPVSPPGLQSGSDDFISPKALLESEGEFMAPEELAELEKCHKVYYYGQFARCGSKIFDPPLFPNSRTGIFPFRMFAHMNFRYEIISGLGEGSFGHVVKAYDHKTKTFCAVKIVRSDPTILAQAEEERKILRHLNKVSQKHHNVVQLLDSFQFYGHLCFVFELQGDSLYDVLKKRNFKGLSLTAVRRIAHDVLKCLLLLSQENIVHTDLKPENILINNHTRNKNQLLDCSLATLRTMTRFDVASPLPAITSQEVYNATVIDFGCSDFVGKT
ncbi:CMGC/DYRK/DYRK2 protein kinase, partial [Sphaeroforma arctica JP610]